MSLMFVLIPFIVATVFVISISFFLKINNRIIFDANWCKNIEITSDLINKVNNLTSIPNEPFRADESITCLEYLYNQDMANGCKKNENAILFCMDGKI